MTVAERVRQLVGRAGPMPFDRFVELALYDPDGGFFATGHGAGRAGRDFVTSPEVGSSFGAYLARALDGWWDAMGAPDPFVVVETGAGTGRLARDVLRVTPRCAPALRYVLVERSAALRAAQRDHLDVEPPDEVLGPFVRPAGDLETVPVHRSGPIVTALDDLPSIRLEGVVVANELVDNLPFGLAAATPRGWDELLVGVDGDRLVEVSVPAGEIDAAQLREVFGDRVAVGTRVPIPRGLDAWLLSCGSALRRGVLAVVDYVVDASELVARGPQGWLRTYRAHGRGGPPLDDAGAQDITADVVREQLLRAAHRAGFHVVSDDAQADWLRALGIDADVEASRREWDARAHLGDLAAVAARSRVSEAAALTDPSGLGAHRVVVFRRDRA